VSKLFTKQLVALYCSLIGFLTFAVISTPVTLADGHHAQQFRHATAAPTSTGNTPTLTLSEPTMDSSPIGHPGTKVDITGQGFTPNSTLQLYTTVDPNQCAAGGSLTPFSSQPTETVQGDGTFDLQTTWPNNANQPGTAYYVCALSATTAGESAISGQTFSVALPVTVSASSTSVNPGDTITITGDNWLPPQQLQVSIIPSQGGDSNTVIASTTTTPDANGHFSVDLTITSDAQPGQYGISVVAPNEPTLANQPNNTTITVNAQATPTPTPTPTPTATPTPTPTPTATPTTGSSGGLNGGSVTILASILAGLGLLCVIVGGVMFAVAGPSSGSSPSRMQ
jgi:hypothetical protein